MQVNNFSYPLNVFACALNLEEGRCDYLHYGLFETPDEPAWQAQEHSTALLLQSLPDIPCKVLEVGIGMGSTAEKLNSLGYEVTAISPDSAQVEYAKDRLHKDIKLQCAKFEDFSVEAEDFDLVLFQESAQYIDTIDILQKSGELLKENGYIIILDEFLERKEYVEPHQLHSMAYFSNQMSRLGYETETRKNLTSQARITVDYLIRVISRHKENIANELSLSGETIQDLLSSLEIYRKKYREGQYGYWFIKIKKARKARWRLTTYDSKQNTSILKLFKVVFELSRDEQYWKWKYETDLGHAVLAWKGDVLIAHYGGAGRDILFFGQQEKAVQICDVMVDPAERTVFTKNGAFFQCASTFLEKYIGYGSVYYLGFGFPNKRVMKLANKLGLYGQVDHLQEVVWKCQPIRLPILKKSVVLSEELLHDESLKDVVNNLWKSMRHEMKDQITGIRDWDYINHRYINHPEIKYTFMLVKSVITGKVAGLAIFRDIDKRCLLMDIIGSLSDFPLIIGHVINHAYNKMYADLYTWITWHNYKYYSCYNSDAKDLDICIPTSIHTDGPDVGLLTDKWWLTIGDTDFH